MKIDWKLKGSNLFHFDCSKDATVHPETCLSQVLTEHDGNSSLNDWITTDSNNTSYELTSSLMDWLQTYYPLSTQLGFTGIPGLDDTNSIILGEISVGDDPTVYMRAPFGSASTAGVLKVNTSKGLIVANGILNISSASNSSFGVIKTGYPESGNNKPVLLDNNGNAYVNISGGTAQATIGGWNFNGTIAELDPAPIMYFNTGDAFASIDLSNYVSQITSVFTGTPDSYKFYPVRTDIDGRAYVYVPWNSVTYRTFTSNVDGLVPAPGINSNKQYLRADGTWGEVPYPSRFTLNKDGLVNYPTAANQYNFLRGDGSWQDVTAAFTGATTTQNGVKGMVPAPAVADKEKFLKGDGTWGNEDMSSYSTLTMGPITGDISIDVEENTKYVYTTSTESAADYKFTVSSIQDSCRESIIIIKDDNVTPVVKSIYLPKNLIYKIDGVLYTQLTYPEDNYINLDSSLILIRISHSIVYLDYIK
jgi:hypothetical protein